MTKQTTFSGLIVLAASMLLSACPTTPPRQDGTGAGSVPAPELSDRSPSELRSRADAAEKANQPRKAMALFHESGLVGSGAEAAEDFAAAALFAGRLGEALRAAEELLLARFLLYRILPGAVLLALCVGVGWTAGEFASEGGCGVLASHGVHPFRLFMPFLAVAVLATGLLYHLVHVGLPQARHLKNQLLRSPPEDPQRLLEALRAGQYRLPHLALAPSPPTGVVLLRDTDQGHAQVIRARDVRLEGEPAAARRLWVFTDGSAVDFDPDHPEQTTRLDFQRFELGMDLTQVIRAELTPDLDELPTAELRRRYSQDEQPLAATLLAQRWAMVLAPAALVLAVLAAVLWAQERTLPVRAAASVFPALGIFYPTLVVVERLAAEGTVPAALVVGLPIVPLGLGALGLLHWRLFHRLPRGDS